MTPEQQRIAIAEACGINHGVLCAGTDYLNDLNAMHEAEKTLTHEQRWKYIPALVSDSGNHVAFATATQRAEAFLRTLGLWEVEP